MSVSLCVLRVEVDEDIPEMSQNHTDIGNYLHVICLLFSEKKKLQIVPKF